MAKYEYKIDDAKGSFLSVASLCKSVPSGRANNASLALLLVGVGIVGINSKHLRNLGNGKAVGRDHFMMPEALRIGLKTRLSSLWIELGLLLPAKVSI